MRKSLAIAANEPSTLSRSCIPRALVRGNVNQSVRQPVSMSGEGGGTGLLVLYN